MVEIKWFKKAYSIGSSLAIPIPKELKEALQITERSVFQIDKIEQDGVQGIVAWLKPEGSVDEPEVEEHNGGDKV